MKNFELKIGLCQGRHEIPDVQEFVFGQEIAPELLTNPQELESESAFMLSDSLPGQYQEDTNTMEAVDASMVDLQIFATGLTVALIAAINAARKLGFNTITVMHYDRESRKYFPQEVV